MTTFVRKIAPDQVLVLIPGSTIVIGEQRVPFGNLMFYSDAELLAIAIYKFEPPVPPQGQVLVGVTYQATPEGVAQVPTFENAPPPPEPNRVLIYGVARFTVAAGVISTTIDTVRIASVLRVSPGRYRVYHLDADPDRRLIPAVALLDAAVRIGRISARTSAYTEIRVTDGAGAAADASDVTLRLDRVI